MEKYENYSTSIIKQYVESLKYASVINNSYLLGKLKQCEVSKMQTILFLKNLVKVEKSFMSDNMTKKMLERQKKGLSK
jgi:hypothetical protein